MKKEVSIIIVNATFKVTSGCDKKMQGIREDKILKKSLC